MSNTLVAAPAKVANPKDDLGIDRAFIIQMSQVPFLAVLFVIINFAAHAIWAQPLQAPKILPPSSSSAPE